MKLAIISHTEHYTADDGRIVGWGPTVTELNHLLEVFEEIWHVAMWHDGSAPKSALPYEPYKIHFVPIPTVGGYGLGAKLSILWQAPKTLAIIRQTLKQVDCFQFRAPTGIGVYVLPFLSWYRQKPGWFKYAGNWNQDKPPLGYRWQRWWLKQQTRTVTVNGHWPKQPKHCLSFENPCLTQEELKEGLLWSGNRSIPRRWTFCYVGRIEDAKGVGRILEALKTLEPNYRSRIACVHLVGEGKSLDAYRLQANDCEIPILFHGALSRKEVFGIYKESDVFLMPTTASEGFPKVIAEAMNFGCIPMVSQVSAITQYVEDQKHGWILENVEMASLHSALKDMMSLSSETYLDYVSECHEQVGPFSFKYYNDRIRSISAGFIK
ncbi:glycosyltransferase [Mangrovimonas sp. YM274]|uniref:glycosyltransferase n=1 Tax=Mangrovimonas sp. YM274 TaxID=3070660 RepID=UPI0027DABA13|nr:glycosyltransferase [Mangrovimonas sp. YM274]WMI69863.1 glycosyltransferase [Mangrovimonas sp. YM274]